VTVKNRIHFIENRMESNVFVNYRKFFKRSQSDLASLLGTSLRSVQAYEQGWRDIPPNIERMMHYLMHQKLHGQRAVEPCWEIKKCPNDWKEKCPAYQFQGGPCWFINGTFCEGQKHNNWTEKMESCGKCTMLIRVMQGKQLSGFADSMDI